MHPWLWMSLLAHDPGCTYVQYSGTALLYWECIFTRGGDLGSHFTTKESIWIFMTGYLWLSSNFLRSKFILFSCLDPT